MTEDANLSLYPSTLREWEYVLTAALLHADGTDADAIRSFEITPETLAEHCGLGVEHAPGAEEAFRRALKAHPYLYGALQNGTPVRPGPQVPNCMSILALSLLVDSLLDGEYASKGQYREKLAQWLGVDRSFTNLSGIATMWGELVAWLDARIEAGERFRRLILPAAPKSWTHIGYTRHLSFPTRRDMAVLRRVIELDPTAAEDAWRLVLLLDQLAHSSSMSFGMNAAFQDFRKALRAGSASVDHRFWRLVIRARALTGHVEAPASTFQMEFDQDGARHYRVTVAGSGDALLTTDVSSAIASKRLQASPNLGPAARRGILFFRSIGLASWTASGEPPAGPGPFHIAMADRHMRLASGLLPSLGATGVWHVTSQPVDGNALSNMLKSLGLLSANNSVRSIGLADGVQVGRSWLGQPRYLPIVEGAGGKIQVRRVGNVVTPTMTCVDGALHANEPIEGDYNISDEAGHWLRRESFVSVAEVHADLNGAAYDKPPQVEWHTKGGKPTRTFADGTGWDERPYELQDMVEAIYACARSGIGEGDLVPLIGRVAGGRPWDMLRLLQETTLLDPRLRMRWRGRLFTLGRPTITDIKIAGEPGALVSGMLPIRLELDLRETIALHGGRAFRRLSPESLAPPILGAAGVIASELATALGWTRNDPPALPDGTAATRLFETSVLAESYTVASKWDWSAGRFCIDTAASGPVSLVRLIHPGGRDHDIYRVTGTRTRSFTSRHAAILDAHQQAGRPLFRLEGDRIRRIGSEGALPIEIARALRFRTLTNAGARDGGWEYFVTPEDVRWLNGLLPGVIHGAAGAIADPALSYRRGRGARRPVWRDGGIVA